MLVFRFKKSSSDNSGDSDMRLMGGGQQQRNIPTIGQAATATAPQATFNVGYFGNDDFEYEYPY